MLISPASYWSQYHHDMANLQMEDNLLSSMKLLMVFLWTALSFQLKPFCSQPYSSCIRPKRAHYLEAVHRIVPIQHILMTDKMIQSISNREIYDQWIIILSSYLDLYLLNFIFYTSETHLYQYQESGHGEFILIIRTGVHIISLSMKSNQRWSKNFTWWDNKAWQQDHENGGNADQNTTNKL